MIFLIAIVLGIFNNLKAQVITTSPWTFKYFNSTQYGSLETPLFVAVNGINKSISEVKLMTNYQSKSSSLRMLNNQFLFFPNPSVIFSTNGTTANLAGIVVQGGDNSGFSSFIYHTADWKQNIQSVVNRGNSLSYIVNYNGMDRFFVSGNGFVGAYGYYSASDQKIKENILPLKGSLERVLKLQGVHYNRKKEILCDGCDKEKTVLQSDESLHIGFIAQDIEKIVPEVVKDMPNGLKAVAYQELVALLVEAIKEQNTKIAQLELLIKK